MGAVQRALTIAGSDNSGGAGIQADLKTFTAFGVYGMSALTAVTAQNTLGVVGYEPVSLDLIAKQIDTVLNDIGVDAAKTGMLANAEIVALVAAKVRERGIANLVVDPVMVAKSGHSLLDEDAQAAVRELLLPLALVATPNVPEAEALTGLMIDGPGSAREVARKLHALGVRYPIVKGGHMRDEHESVDLVYDGSEFSEFRAARQPTMNTHGTGCTFSAAITAGLAQGLAPLAAIEKAKRYITRAIETSLAIGRGHGPTNHLVDVTSKWV
jgi:hydroxymethylpyrimidine/phosphomethylpyrimidine kinase